MLYTTVVTDPLWPGGVMVRELDLRLNGRGFDSWPFRFQVGQVVHTHVPLSARSIIYTGQGAVIPCGWEGNRRSVALAMCHRLQWFLHLRSHGLCVGDEPSLLNGVWHTLPLIILLKQAVYFIILVTLILGNYSKHSVSTTAGQHRLF